MVERFINVPPQQFGELLMSKEKKTNTCIKQHHDPNKK